MQKIERLQASLHLVGAPPTNKHTVFVDDEEQQQSFEPSQYFDTDPDLVGRAFNRPKKETLESAQIVGAPLDSKKEQRKAKRQREKSYAELEARIERSAKMAKLADTIDRDRELLKKGRRIKVAEAADGRPAVFKWKTERKK